MKKKLTAALAALVLILFLLYIWLVAVFQGPVVADITQRVTIFPEEQRIELPWYLSLCSQEDIWFEGTDPDGNAYTWFCSLYSGPGAFPGSAEMNYIINWDDQTVMLYLGESKAMEVIDLDFPDVQWN